MSASKNLLFTIYISKLHAIIVKGRTITFNMLIYNDKYISKKAGANVRLMKNNGHIWLMAKYDHDAKGGFQF